MSSESKHAVTWWPISIAILRPCRLIYGSSRNLGTMVVRWRDNLQEQLHRLFCPSNSNPADGERHLAISLRKAVEIFDAHLADTTLWRKITALEGSRRRGPLRFCGEASRRRTSCPYFACSSTGRAHGRIEVPEFDAPLGTGAVRLAAVVDTACKPGSASLRGEQGSFRPMYCSPPVLGTLV